MSFSKVTDEPNMAEVGAQTPSDTNLDATNNRSIQLNSKNIERETPEDGN